MRRTRALLLALPVVLGCARLRAPPANPAFLPRETAREWRVVTLGAIQLVITLLRLGDLARYISRKLPVK